MMTLEDAEKQHILAVMDAVDWNRTRAAKVLQIGVRTLQRKLEIYGMKGHRAASTGRPRKVEAPAP